MANVFGFSTESSSGGDFLPIIKYDSRAGRFFRVDRVDSGNGLVNEPVDITANVKFLADFENIEVGWINFMPGQQPDFRLVPMGTQMPERASPDHKTGIRFMLKLAKECAGDKPVREIAGTAKAFLSGVEAVYTKYFAERGKHPGQLPVIVLEKTTPVKTGAGTTNYHPIFKIAGWAARGDLAFVAKAGVVSPAAQPANVAPSTGRNVAPAPAQAAVAADDFG